MSFTNLNSVAFLAPVAESGILKEEDLLQSEKQKLHSCGASLGNYVLRASNPWPAFSFHSFLLHSNTMVGHFLHKVF